MSTPFQFRTPRTEQRRPYGRSMGLESSIFSPRSSRKKSMATTKPPPEHTALMAELPPNILLDIPAGSCGPNVCRIFPHCNLGVYISDRRKAVVFSVPRQPGESCRVTSRIDLPFSDHEFSSSLLTISHDQSVIFVSQDGVVVHDQLESMSLPFPQAPEREYPHVIGSVFSECGQFMVAVTKDGSLAAVDMSRDGDMHAECLSLSTMVEENDEMGHLEHPREPVSSASKSRVSSLIGWLATPFRSRRKETKDLSQEVRAIRLLTEFSKNEDDAQLIDESGGGSTVHILVLYDHSFQVWSVNKAQRMYLHDGESMFSVAKEFELDLWSYRVLRGTRILDADFLSSVVMLPDTFSVLTTCGRLCRFEVFRGEEDGTTRFIEAQLREEVKLSHWEEIGEDEKGLDPQLHPRLWTAFGETRVLLRNGVYLAEASLYIPAPHVLGACDGSNILLTRGSGVLKLYGRDGSELRDKFDHERAREIVDGRSSTTMVGLGTSQSLSGRPSGLIGFQQSAMSSARSMRRDRLGGSAFASQILSELMQRHESFSLHLRNAEESDRGQIAYLFMCLCSAIQLRECVSSPSWNDRSIVTDLFSRAGKGMLARLNLEDEASPAVYQHVSEIMQFFIMCSRLSCGSDDEWCVVAEMLRACVSGVQRAKEELLSDYKWKVEEIPPPERIVLSALVEFLRRSHEFHGVLERMETMQDAVLDITRFCLEYMGDDAYSILSTIFTIESLQQDVLRLAFQHDCYKIILEMGLEVADVYQKYISGEFKTDGMGESQRWGVVEADGEEPRRSLNARLFDTPVPRSSGSTSSSIDREQRDEIENWEIRSQSKNVEDARRFIEWAANEFPAHDIRPLFTLPCEEVVQFLEPRDAWLVFLRHYHYEECIGAILRALREEGVSLAFARTMASAGCMIAELVGPDGLSAEIHSRVSNELWLVEATEFYYRMLHESGASSGLMRYGEGLAGVIGDDDDDDEKDYLQCRSLDPLELVTSMSSFHSEIIKSSDWAHCYAIVFDALHLYRLDFGEEKYEECYLAIIRRMWEDPSIHRILPLLKDQNTPDHVIHDAVKKLSLYDVVVKMDEETWNPYLFVRFGTELDPQHKVAFNVFLGVIEHDRSYA